MSQPGPERIERLWYGSGRPLWPLLPLACAYRQVAEHRRRRFQRRQPALSLPVIVVGNITAGGTGKSPLAAWLARLLAGQGWRPVILSRGYGVRLAEAPVQVTEDSAAAAVGDEPVMLARSAGCPVVVDPDRLRAARWVESRALGNLLICDDGLQHYRLPRDIEIAVFDGSRGIGNGALLPVGPLREPVTRLADTDFVVVNGEPGERVPAHPRRHIMDLQPVSLTHLNSGEARPLSWLQGREVTAIAGIGNPARFFATLEGLGARVQGHGYPDHHHYSAAELFPGQGPVIMTAKDAVKAGGIGHDDCWVLAVEASLPDDFRTALLAELPPAPVAGQP